jgi:hypothetical protein
MEMATLNRETLMLVQNFSSRAEECLKLAERAHTPHDRELFLEMARAWYGLSEDKPDKAAETKH